MTQDRWYNLIATFYDVLALWPYQKLRHHAIARLAINKGDTVIDLGCGTGANLKQLSRAVGSGGTVIAVEPAEKMLAIAKYKSAKNKLNNVYFINQDIELFLHCHDFQVHKAKKLKVLSILVMSVMTNWPITLDRLIAKLPAGCVLVIADLYSDKKTFVSWVIDKLAQADSGRTSWQRLEHKLQDYKFGWHRLCCYFGVKAFISSGKK